MVSHNLHKRTHLAYGVLEVVEKSALIWPSFEPLGKKARMKRREVAHEEVEQLSQRSV